MTIDKISLFDSLGQEYELPKTFELRSDPTGRRSKRLDMAFVHGSRDVSDGMFTSKMVEVTGRIWAATDALYNAAWDALAEHLLKDNLRIQDRGRQINLLKVVSISHTYPSQEAYHYGEVSITFLAADPFWYAASASQKQQAVTSSPKSFQHDIGGKMETWPIITIENNANNYDFKLENDTDDDREFRIIDTGADSGTDIVIDCKEGTVKRDGTNIISTFSGLFLRLLGGRTNDFLYTGANCDITIQYHEAWI